jgi:hypothetical protein
VTCPSSHLHPALSRAPVELNSERTETGRGLRAWKQILEPVFRSLEQGAQAVKAKSDLAPGWCQSGASPGA